MCCNECRKANEKGNKGNVRYHTSGGFFAYIPQLDRYILFPTEMEYWEYMNEFENENKLPEEEAAIKEEVKE